MWNISENMSKCHIPEQQLFCFTFLVLPVFCDSLCSVTGTVVSFFFLFTWTPEKLLNLKFASIDKCRETDTHTGVTCHRSRDWTQAAPYPAYPAGRLTAPQRTASDWGIKHGGQGMCPVGQCASPVCGCVYCLWIRCVFVKLLLGFKFFYSTV